MVRPLIASESQLDAHLKSVGSIISANVDPSANVILIADWSIVPLVAGLVGSGSETTSRNRGAAVPVAPMIVLGSGLWAWLGYREEWASEPPAGKSKRYSFRFASLSIHFGYRNSLHKPQMFRAEWAGWAKWDGDDYGYQAGEAAHPHWQFDALESLKRDEVAERAAEFLSVLRSEQEGVAPKEFSPSALSRDDVGDVIGTQELSRLHFASAAAWWKRPPEHNHAHAPDSAMGVQNWIKRTLSYVVNELCRLQEI